MSNRSYSGSESNEGNECEYCIFLHVVEGMGLYPRERGSEYSDRYIDKILMIASLNGVQFEVEGQNTESTTIFNSNCIWECDLDDIKRMKTDNRPVKMEFFIKFGASDNVPRKVIGTLLLPIRGLVPMSTPRSLQVKLLWHKLVTFNAEWRKNKPEIYLFFIIIKKQLLGCSQLAKYMGNRSDSPDLLAQASETAFMLQSQSNVYVQLLEQAGLIQVGNNPDVDCDIFRMTLTFKQVKNVSELVAVRRSHQSPTNYLVFNYDLLGTNAHSEIFIEDGDCYNIGEKISLNFKSSLSSLRDYFNRIFYVPINLFCNNAPIANFRLNFSDLLPHPSYFNSSQVWSKNSSFYLNLHSTRAVPQKPSVDFIFVIELISSSAKKPISNGDDCASSNHTFDMKSVTDLPQNVYDLPHPNQLSPQKISNLEHWQKHVEKSMSEALASGRTSGGTVEMTNNGGVIKNQLSYRFPNQLNNICEGTKDMENNNRNSNARDIVKTATVGVNTEPIDLKIPDQADTDAIAKTVVQELEDWKAHQMDQFLQQLKKKETAHMNDLKLEWDLHVKTEQAKLDAKMAKYEELTDKLMQSHAPSDSRMDIGKVFEDIKHELDTHCAQNFQTIDAQMDHIRASYEEKENMLEVQNKVLEKETFILRGENRRLQEEIDKLEEEMASIKSTHLSADQLKDVLDDLRIQNERFLKMQKSNAYYKEQWTNTAKELDKLKLMLISQQKMCRRVSDESTINLCLKEILDERENIDANEPPNPSSYSSEMSMAASDVEDTDTSYRSQYRETFRN